MKICLPDDVLLMIDTLNRAGHSAYAVGGCVRDVLRGEEPSDWDITTAATPEEIMALFEHTVPTGLQHGTVTVLIGKNAYEVTTFRVDGDYSDHRRPEQVVFTKDITEDLSRRDFTMNAMAYHPETGLCDPFGGQADIEKGLIRCVGDPMVRFDEDALRMMRAVRFAARTGFVIDDEILRAMRAQAELIRAVSAERIRDELVKTLCTDRPEGVEILHDTGILKLILPEVDQCFGVEQHSKYHIYDVGHHIMQVVHHAPNSVTLRVAALLHDIGKPGKKTTDEAGFDHFKFHDLLSTDLSERILTRLRFDNHTKERVLRLVRHHDRRMAATKHSVRKAASAVGPDLFLELLELMRADAKGQEPVHGAKSLAHYEQVEAIFRQVTEAGDALQIADLAIGGRELMELGYKGPQVGEMLRRVLTFVLEFPEENEKERLLAAIKSKKIKN